MPATGRKRCSLPKVDQSWNLKRIEQEIENALLETERDSSCHGDDIFWLMGWADWTIEREFYLAD